MRAPHEHPEDPKLLGYIFAAAQARCGVRVCAWCNRFMGLARQLGEGKITHGICPACEVRVQAEFDKLPAAVGTENKQAEAATQPTDRRPFSEVCHE